MGIRDATKLVTVEVERNGAKKRVNAIDASPLKADGWKLVGAKSALVAAPVSSGIQGAPSTGSAPAAPTQPSSESSSRPGRPRGRRSGSGE